MSPRRDYKRKPFILIPIPLFLSAVLLCGVQHGVYRGTGRLWEHLRPAAGAVWEFLWPVQKRYAAQPGRPIPLLCFIQQLRPSGPEKVHQSGLPCAGDEYYWIEKKNTSCFFFCRYYKYIECWPQLCLQAAKCAWFLNERRKINCTWNCAAKCQGGFEEHG